MKSLCGSGQLREFWALSHASRIIGQRVFAAEESLEESLSFHLTASRV
jgi:hypothetical protein